MQLRQNLLTKLTEILEQAERAIEDLPEGLTRARIQHVRGLAKQLAFAVKEQFPEAPRHGGQTRDADVTRPR